MISGFMQSMKNNNNKKNIYKFLAFVSQFIFIPTCLFLCIVLTDYLESLILAPYDFLIILKNLYKDFLKFIKNHQYFMFFIFCNSFLH